MQLFALKGKPPSFHAATISAPGVVSRLELITTKKTSLLDNRLCLQSSPSRGRSCLVPLANTLPPSDTPTPPDTHTEVSCVYMKNCTLPCSYEGADVVIHWFQVSAGNLSVHSFFKNQDQPENSAQRFRGRASTFKDQISRGNASVLLTGVKVQDEGRYKCYTSTTSGNKESFINLKIDAPIHKLTIELAVKRITCRSEGIYPKPELTWSTSPPSNLTFKNTTTVQQTEQQLYNISSYLIPSSSDEDLEYSCTISTRRNREEVTVTNKFSLDEIKCRPPNIQISNLIWRFNFKEVILNGTVTNYTVSEKWKQHVKKLSESGSLTLQNVPADLVGFYTCEVNDAEETTISLRSVESHKGAIVGGVIAAIVITVVVAAVGLVLYKHKREQQERRRRDNETHTNTELQPMTAPSSDASAPQ